MGEEIDADEGKDEDVVEVHDVGYSDENEDMGFKRRRMMMMMR